MQRLTPEAFQDAHKTPIVVILDNVRSMHNVGAVFRTADALCLEGVALCGITATPPQPEIHKTALGAEEVVSWTYYNDAVVAVQQLQAEGYSVWAVEQTENSTFLQDLPSQLPNKPIALVLGNEVKGVQQSVIDLCDGVIEIPQHGTKHSLNVSVAAGMVLWVVSRCMKL